MAIPKSVTKLKTKGGKCSVEFTSSVDRVNYTLEQLIRRANMDVGKYIVRMIRQALRKDPAIKGIAKGKYVPMRYQYWARKSENDLQIGVENIKFASDPQSAWWADQSELGTNGQPKRAFIYSTVKDNISTIRDIQGQYLSAIEDEQEAIRLAEEAENAEDAADEMANE